MDRSAKIPRINYGHMKHHKQQMQVNQNPKNCLKNAALVQEKLKGSKVVHAIQI